jgi:hypothetical protein
MTVIEWTAVGIVCSVLVVAAKIWCSELSATKKDVSNLNNRMATIEDAQMLCQKNLADRLSKGDQSFDRINEQVAHLSSITVKLAETAKNLSDTVNKIEQRVWNGHDRRGD